MDRYFHLYLPIHSRKGSVFTLACCWFLGLVAGFFFSLTAGVSLIPTMRAANDSCVSIPGLLSATFLPLLFSAFAVYISRPWLLFPIAFGKAFTFSYVAVSVMAAFGSAGWLVRWLLMFSDSCGLPLLWWYWVRVRSVNRRNTARVTAAAFVVALLIGSVDYCLISPLVANLKF